MTDIGGGLKFNNAETEAVVAVLEQEHEDAATAARAVLRSALSALLQRDMWITAVIDPQHHVFDVGYFFFTEAAAVKSVQTNALGVLTSSLVGILHLSSGDRRMEWVEAQP